MCATVTVRVQAESKVEVTLPDGTDEGRLPEGGLRGRGLDCF